MLRAGCVGVYPLEARDAIVQARGKWSDFRYFGRVHGVAEFNHGHRDAIGGDRTAPGLVIAFKAGTHLHAAAVGVVNARQSLVVIRPDVPDLDGVSIGRGGEGLDAYAQADGRCDLLAVHRVEEGCLTGQCGQRRWRVFLCEQFFAARNVQLFYWRRPTGEHLFDPGIKTGIGFDLRWRVLPADGAVNSIVAIRKIGPLRFEEIQVPAGIPQDPLRAFDPPIGRGSLACSPAGRFAFLTDQVTRSAINAVKGLASNGKSIARRVQSNHFPIRQL
jgi:hypothetical protein